MKPNEISAVVLAGGYSSRMGRDKAALPFGDGTLLTHQAEKLTHLGIQEIMISGSEIEVPGTRYVPDVYPHRGPLSGIHACLSAAMHEAVLFLSVDVPLVPMESLQALISAHETGVTLLEHDGKFEPLIAVYDCTLAPICEEILQSDHTAVKNLLQRAPLQTVRYSGDPARLTNCNTPEEYNCMMQMTSD